MTVSKIEWCDRTWNPVRGCSRVSRGCDNCYAMKQAHRFDFRGGAYEGLTRLGKRGVDWTGVVRLVPELLDAPLRWREPQRIFVNSMSDLFHESLPDEAIDRVFGVMRTARRHTFQILTKRPKRMSGYAFLTETLPNVWLGVSVEDQATADERIPLLLQTPAAKRFVSYEAGLAGVDFTRLCGGTLDALAGHDFEAVGDVLDPGILTNTQHPPGLDWLIVGGESGPGARPFEIAWARSVVKQCREAGVACFVKQLGAHPVIPSLPPGLLGSAVMDAAQARDREWPQGTLFGNRTGDPKLNGRIALLKHSKGGDLKEWPEDLRIREFPASAHAESKRSL